MFGDGEEGVVEHGGAGDGVASADGFEDGLNVVVELGHKDGGGFVRTKCSNAALQSAPNAYCPVL